MTSADETPIPDYASLLRLDGRGVLVLGAGQGNGRQTAHALAALGASVACVDIDPVLADEIAREVGGLACVGDVRERGDVDRVTAEAVAAFGRVHAAVDIVGLAHWAAFLDVTDELWDDTFAIVLRHAQYVAQAVGRHMVENGGGAMVFIASVSGLSSAPFHAPYGAAKAGLMSLVRTAAVELGPYGVRVNAIAPGHIETPRVLRMTAERGGEDRPPQEPLGRHGQPSDIAGAALFLCSDLARHVSGQTLTVDGGITATFPYTR